MVTQYLIGQHIKASHSKTATHEQVIVLMRISSQRRNLILDEALLVLEKVGTVYQTELSDESIAYRYVLRTPMYREVEITTQNDVTSAPQNRRDFLENVLKCLFRCVELVASSIYVNRNDDERRAARRTYVLA